MYRTTWTIATLLILLPACTEYQQSTPVVGEVLEVRITSSNETSVSGGSAMGGAVAGALIAGTTGAIIGGAMGSDAKRTAVSGKLLGCRLAVQMEDGIAVVFTTTERQQAFSTRCSLLRNGDKLKFWKNELGVYTWSEPGEILPLTSQPLL